MLNMNESIKVANTREIIEKLVAYEEENGVGAVVGLAMVCNGNRTNQYIFEIANGTFEDRALKKEGYKKTEIKISAVEDQELFNR